MGGLVHSEYSYGEAVYNNKGRGFQGFREIIEDQDQPGSTPLRTRAVYHQKFPLTGLLECSERRTAFESPYAPTQPIERTRTHWIGACQASCRLSHAAIRFVVVSA